MEQKSDATNIDFVTFKNSQNLQARGTLIKLARNDIVFEVYNPYSIVQLSEVLSELTIYRAEKQIYRGRAVVSSIVSTGIILIVSAILDETAWKGAVDIRSRKEIEDEVSVLISRFEAEQKINQDFKSSILSTRSFLHDLRNWFDKLEPSISASGIEVNEKFIVENFTTIFTKLTELFRNAATIISTTVNKDNNEPYKRFVYNYLHPFLMPSPFPYRAYSKPLGFAGDYMMMYMIQQDSALGNSLYTKFINVFYAYIPLSRSVNHRTTNLLRLIEEGVALAEKNDEEFNSISIGCGPALEVKKFIEKNNPKVKCNFTLLDFNQETLDFAANEASKVIGDKNCTIEKKLHSVHELLKSSVSKKFNDKKYDLVYCSGLFDYLSDKVCSKLTEMFFDMTKNNGRVLVTNMHSNDVDHYIVEMVLEWYLIYRDEKNMASFVPGLGQQKLYTDSTGINLCLEITKI